MVDYQMGPGEHACSFCGESGFLIGIEVPIVNWPIMVCVSCIREITESEEPWDLLGEKVAQTVGEKVGQWVSGLGSALSGPGDTQED